MKLAIRGIDGNLGLKCADSFHRDFRNFRQAGVGA